MGQAKTHYGAQVSEIRAARSIENTHGTHHSSLTYEPRNLGHINLVSDD